MVITQLILSHDAYGLEYAEDLRFYNDCVTDLDFSNKYPQRCADSKRSPPPANFHAAWLSKAFMGVKMCIIVDNCEDLMTSKTILFSILGTLVYIISFILSSLNAVDWVKNGYRGYKKYQLEKKERKYLGGLPSQSFSPQPLSPEITEEVD